MVKFDENSKLNQINSTAESHPFLLVVVVLGGDDDLVGDEEGGVEADAELTDEVVHLLSVRRVLQLGKEVGRARLGDGAQVVDQVLMGRI